MTQDFATRIIAPGSTIGIMGNGQLGRMAALCAAELGYKVHVFGPGTDSPTEQVCAKATVADYTDLDALRAFAADVDVVTFEFENVPHDSVKLLSELVPVRPGWKCLHLSQNRLREKTFCNKNDIGTAPFAAVRSLADLEAAVAKLGRPSVLKTTEMGYDGKGQVKITGETSLTDAWAEMNGAEAILEGFISFEREISVIVARGVKGDTACFCPVENVHTNHILDVTIAPAKIPADLARKAEDIATRLVEAMEFVGLLAVEMFVTTDGDVLVNEVAPRPHNSGHWTIDACVTSQFEQFIRAVCGLPLGNPAHHSNARMKNLLGHDIDDWQAILAEPDAKLHLYGKAEAKAGRKMGHVTWVLPKKD
ncbi:MULTISPECIES: 5-(carboxyamino)imidazole ribonucleotide synthase [Thalassospira]|jgi:5-(carboxyamino)imidazole ribonucleotide synthase|nr:MULTISPECIES: 5-(carboxyamino)imidazole ribonucleotide synthase [Thalassospira]MAB33271.1 5-(carboxyamino)imidazole ribonucleotide synthase [Thalassospira sp.]MDM7977886.1 5-(carboxyamino)imidazole ribonucleotide synthase [Thalassospira xiamenensis]OHZ03589.1 5-(carboxyamino)imidazole ribonucleotide synthase [Thalassospira sp. MIT1004]HBN50291.1 5-(carboxyamino)imidazole ribonucleotide synthase [Thalassospira sp.]|tara:strand:+ start:426 stop:1520 length:1095 start_codon:yes stop_codon:yes gene_type:complete